MSFFLVAINSIVLVKMMATFIVTFHHHKPFTLTQNLTLQPCLEGNFDPVGYCNPSYVNFQPL